LGIQRIPLQLQFYGCFYNYRGSGGGWLVVGKGNLFFCPHFSLATIMFD